MLKKKNIVSAITIFILFVLLYGMVSAKSYPIADGNTADDNLIPQSRIHRIGKNGEQDILKENRLLKAFRTPEQQFIPIGFYAVGEYLKDVSILKAIERNHVNLVHKYKSIQDVHDALDDLKIAEKAGIGVLQNLPKGYLKEGDIFWEKFITEIADQQKLAVWYLPEEVDPEDIRYIAGISNIIRRVDTRQRPIITYVKNFERGYWEEAAACTDALVFGAYPILLPTHPRAITRRIIDKAYEVGVPVVIKAVEAYAKDGRWTKPEEVRFDTYLSLISGAKGVLWYCYYRAHENDDLMNEIYNISLELNGPEKIGEIFLRGENVSEIHCELLDGDLYAPPATAFENKTQKIKMRYTTIQWCAKKYGKTIYLFAVNMNERIGATNHGGDRYGVTVEFKSELFDGAEIEAMYQYPAVKIEKGSFTDTIPPIGTKIYRIQLNDAKLN